MKRIIFDIDRPPYDSDMMELRNGKRKPYLQKKQQSGHAVAEEEYRLPSDEDLPRQAKKSTKKGKKLIGKIV